ncbi:MAG: 5'-methylthioadenosine/S-adenosylhomocysteine nucleosidase [Bacteroidales bacterium]|nr:5'-methylthioadenosine/S-adenosylhomocysteine nucleosidase [Bacteroidales bacterium]
MNILILTAMEKERQMFADVQNDPAFKGHVFAVQPCGIGKVNASVSTVNYIHSFSPDAVISTGVAGGCGEKTEIMDVIAAKEVVYHDVWCGQPNKLGQIQGMPEAFYAPKEWISRIENFKMQGVKIGTTVSGDWFVDTKQKMEEIKHCFPQADAVDMESAAIAHVCHMYKTPFISLRVISDLPLKGNNTQQYKDFWADVQQTSFNTAIQVMKCILQQ